MDISGLAPVLLNNGLAGAIILYLIWDRHNLTQRLDECQKAYTADLLRIVGEFVAASLIGPQIARGRGLGTSTVKEVSTFSCTMAMLAGSGFGGGSMPSDKLRHNDELLTSIRNAARRGPVRLTLGEMQRAGIVALGADPCGIPHGLLVWAQESGCIVWGPYRPNQTEPYYIIESQK